MKPQQLLGIEVAIESKILRQKSDTLFCANITRHPAKYFRIAVLGIDEPHQDAHAGSLARTIRAEKSADLSLGNFERNSRERRHGYSAETSLIDLGYAGELNGWRHSGPLLPAS